MPFTNDKGRRITAGDSSRINVSGNGQLIINDSFEEEFSLFGDQKLELHDPKFLDLKKESEKVSRIRGRGECSLIFFSTVGFMILFPRGVNSRV